MLSSMKSSNIKRNGFEIKPQKRRFDLCVTMVFHFCTKNEDDPMVDTHADSGIRVRPKTRENDKFEKRAISLKNSSPDSKADFSEKFVCGI